MDFVNVCEDPVNKRKTLEYLQSELEKPKTLILSRHALLMEAVTNFVQRLKEQDQFEAFKLECGLQDKKEVASEGNIYIL